MRSPISYTLSVAMRRQPRPTRRRWGLSENAVEQEFLSERVRSAVMGESPKTGRTGPE